MSEVATLPSQRRLGRGLSALLGGGAPAAHEHHQDLHAELAHIPLQRITRNPFQPRKHFDNEALGELAASIREHGLLQPVLVREIDEGYQLVAGERRWLAAQKAGLTSLPCRIVDVIDKTACEFALEENLKRKDLNDLEKAQAFRDYLNQFQCSVEELSKQLSMSRSTVSNILRLLELADPVKNALHQGKLTAGHARALLPLQEAEQLELCGTIQAEQWSVRQTEAAVKSRLGRDQAADETPSPESAVPASDAVATSEEAATSHDAPAAEAQEPNPECQHHEESSAPPETIPMAEADPHRTHHVDSLESQLRDLLGVAVEIKLTSRESGQIVVPFASNAEFERILATLRRSAA